jgi:RecB family endonuclease NucS
MHEAAFIITIDPNGKDDLFYQIDSTRLRLYDSSTDPSPIYNKPNEDVIAEFESPENTNEENEFAYEKDLQNFLAKNLNIIESGLTLYMDEGINGLEFPVGTRAIDILAIDKEKNFVVIELKVSRGYDRVVGQLLRYIAWIRQNHAEENQKVRGIIIAREITEDLLLACSETNNIDLFEYRLSVSLRKIEKNNDYDHLTRTV